MLIGKYNAVDFGGFLKCSTLTKIRHTVDIIV